MTTTYQFKRQRRISPPEQATILMADLMKVVHSSSTLANNNPSQTSVLHSLLRQARRLVSSKPAGYDVSDNETNEIIGKFLSHGLAYVLLQILQSADTKQSTDASILHESLWILVNITASSQHTLSAVTIAHLVPLVANLLFYMHSPHVREQSIWFLAHLAGNDTATRDMLLQSPRVVRGIVYNLESPHNLAILCRSAWAVSNLVQQGNPASKPAPEAILPFLPSVLYNFTYGVQHRVPVEDLLDYVAVIQSLVQNSSMTRQAIVLYKNGEIIQTLGQLIATYGKVVQAAELLCPTCRILGQYAAGTPQETDAVIQCGFLKRSLALLKHMVRF